MTTGESSRSAAAGAGAVVERMAEAATNLLTALAPDQRRRAQFDFPDGEERRRWFYTPTDHGGITLLELNPAQQQRVHQLVATGLSEQGYVTAATIMGIENVLDMREGWRVRFARDRDPSARGRDPQMYYVSIFGEPGGAGPWGWRFGGHHVSLHYTIVDGRIASTTPSFFGSDPAEASFVGGGMLRPLGGEEDLGRALMLALDPDQQEAALLTPIAPWDLVVANRSDMLDGALPPRNWEIWREQLEGAPMERAQTNQARLEQGLGISAQDLEAMRYTRAPKGLARARMRAAQQQLLSDLIGQYLGRMPLEIAAIETRKLDGGALEGLHFAWAGGIERRQPHYYRLQGPRLLIEYDNTQGGGNHIHSVWRDPEGDFGGDVLAQHYAQAH
jgi:hypothetical protein